MVTSKMPPAGQDILTASANNLYEGVTLADLDGFTERYELNARLVKTPAGLVEEVYRVGGRYDAAIRRIVGHLEDAIALAPPPMAEALRALVRFYRTGEVEDRRAYDIAWVADRESPVDTINGFIEVYMDARGCKGSWEAVVWYVNEDKTRQCQAIADAAQWFEDRMPWDPKYRKPTVTGVSARAIDVVVEAGDSAPMTPIGINLPNDQAIRETHGSKSVSLSNIFEAYNKSTPASLREEFSWSPDEAARAERWGDFAAELSTNLHEIIGHGSGLVEPDVAEDLSSRLREQYSTLEETRADLVALYFVADPQLVALGLLDADDHRDIILAEYEGYARNALVQLRRVREGTTLEEDHMRNRQAIVHWLMAHTSAIERRVRDGKTYYVMVDAAAFRDGLRADARRGPADQGAGRPCRRGGAVRRARHALRGRAARRGPGPDRGTGPAGLRRLRPARAGAGARRGRRDRRRADRVSVRFHRPDAALRRSLRDAAGLTGIPWAPPSDQPVQPPRIGPSTTCCASAARCTPTATPRRLSSGRW